MGGLVYSRECTQLVGVAAAWLLHLTTATMLTVSVPSPGLHPGFPTRAPKPLGAVADGDNPFGTMLTLVSRHFFFFLIYF